MASHAGPGRRRRVGGWVRAGSGDPSVGFPARAGGEPRLEGHRIRVRDIAAARDRGGYTPEEISANVYPGLTLAQVYAALAYYEDHRAEIDQAEQAEADFLRDFRERHPDLVRDVRTPSSKA